MALLPRSNQGLTLIEVVVSITIVTILSALITTSLPLVRNQQQVKLTREAIKSQLRIAAQLALNETRAPECLQKAGDSSEAQHRCSDIGVAFQNGQMTMFADTSADNKFTPNNDFVLATLPLSSSVTLTPKTFLFKGTPPTMITFIDGRIQALNQTVDMDLQAGPVKETLTISAYGYTQDNQ